MNDQRRQVQPADKFIISGEVLINITVQAQELPYKVAAPILSALQTAQLISEGVSKSLGDKVPENVKEVAEKPVEAKNVPTNIEPREAPAPTEGPLDLADM